MKYISCNGMKLKYPQFWQKDSILCFLLTPFAWLFTFISFCRESIIRPVKIGKLVVCVGNASVGGTGKTQMIKWLAKYLTHQGISFVIISKGYGSTAKEPLIVSTHHQASEVGDEAVELAEFGEVIVAKKILQAQHLIDKINPKIILVDDGLQNPAFKKDISILTLDPIRGIGNGRTIPAGPMREPLEDALIRSDLVVTIGNEPIQDYSIIQKIQSSGLPYFKAENIMSSELNKTPRYMAFCGIGNPDKFFNYLLAQGYYVIEKATFPDHHKYTNQEINELIKRAKDINCQLITTKKDLVKIPKFYNITAVEVELSFTDKEDEFKELLHQMILSRI